MFGFLAFGMLIGMWVAIVAQKPDGLTMPLTLGLLVGSAIVFAMLDIALAIRAAKRP